MSKSLFSIFLLIIISYATNAENIYLDTHSGFYPFKNASSTNLTIDNHSNTAIIDTIKVNDDYKNLSFCVRAANINNRQDKKYKYLDTDGKPTKAEFTQWGIIAFDQYQNRLEVRLHTDTSSDWEYTAEYCVKTEILLNDNIIYHTTLNASQIDLFTGENSIQLSDSDQNISIALGDRKLITLHTPEIKFDQCKYVGLIVYPATKIYTRRISLTYTPNHANRLTTKWDTQSINRHLSKSLDSLEGYYTYLDRNFDEDLLRLGGKYTVALIKNHQGYDLIYIEGADINQHQWHTGMIKATLKPTKFQKVFAMTWYDSQMLPLSKDVIVQFDNNTMTINFPYQKSSLRLSKIQKP